MIHNENNLEHPEITYSLAFGGQWYDEEELRFVETYPEKKGAACYATGPVRKPE